MYRIFTKSTAAAATAFALAFAALPLASSHAISEKTVEVGGAPMYPSKNIIENAVNSKDHTTLVTAIKAAGLVETLSGKGPFTVFAPVNAAFDKLPEGTVPMLLKPENKAKLSGILTYHVVPGRFTAEELAAKAKASDGQVMLKTVAGGMLTFKWDGKASVVDAKGDTASITIADVMQSNGVIHVIDGVAMPN